MDVCWAVGAGKGKVAHLMRGGGGQWIGVWSIDHKDSCGMWFAELAQGIDDAQ